jgi:hypothetical protein
MHSSIRIAVMQNRNLTSAAESGLSVGGSEYSSDHKNGMRATRQIVDQPSQALAVRRNHRFFH